MELQGTSRVNKKGNLEIGGCDTVELARKFGTPLYVFDEDKIRSQCRSYREGFMAEESDDLVIYASKAFLTLAMAKIIAEEGLGLDVVSGGELFTALQAGFPAAKIFFHGNNKSERELKEAVQAGVGRIVVDNFYELACLDEIAKKENIKQKILLRIAPGIEAHTHDYIKTGQIDSKFGFTLVNGTAAEAVTAVLEREHLELTGLHCHIGSQIFDLDPFLGAIDVMIEFMQEIKSKQEIELKELNIGGGFGIYYFAGDDPKEISTFAPLIKNHLRKKTETVGYTMPRLVIEPGRSIAGPAGTNLYRVGSCKQIPGVRKYIALDGSMSDLIRPALYGAKYEAVSANRMQEEARETISLAGKCCESGDMLVWDIEMPLLEPGDLIAILDTGAYGYTMASNYNRLPKPAAVLVKDGKADLIVKREDYEDLIRNDVLPERLK